MPIDMNVIEAVRSAAERGAAELIINDLVLEDLAELGWSGSRAHLRSIRQALERVAAGEVQYLAVRAPSGEPIAKAGIDFAKRGDAGTIWQLATHPDVQGLGIGTRLIGAAEDRIRLRGRLWAAMAVENNNTRARSLYERLGYTMYGEEETSWEHEDDQGRSLLYETVVTLLHKPL